MIRHITGVLTRAEVSDLHARLAGAPWTDGAATAGPQSARAKRNLQLPEDAPAAREAGAAVLAALGRCDAFISAALPLRVIPPLFNRYGAGMEFTDHIDNAVRFSAVTGARYRTDVSCTLFLSDADAYEGGELLVAGALPGTGIKLPAGDLILYPSTTVHRVTAVTRGERWASVFWVQSMVAEAAKRDLLADLDQDIAAVRAQLGDENATSVSLTGAYHNLVRMWASL